MATRADTGEARGRAKSPPPSGEKLAIYRAKRDFGRTAEPAEGGLPGRGIFVVQHHWARRDHFDFRLELDGVLVSFAVTKGPSPDPSVRRLAVRTEDHPISYAEFEGTIPPGEYGGGTVMVWDRGLWAPMTDDPRRALRDGELKFVLLGERMKGAYVLVRMNVEKGRENWLLIKEKDEYVERGADGWTDRFPTSVKTGRSRAEIEREEVPHSFAADHAAEDEGAPEPPGFVPPTLCAVAERAPEGDDWLHEIKYDGYRIEAAVSGRRVRLYSREGLDWTDRFPKLRDMLARLQLDRALIDGEAVVFDDKGLTDFPALVDALGTTSGAIAYVAFDLLYEGGEDLRDRTLDERRQRLEAVLAKADGRMVRLAPAVAGDGPAVFDSAVAGGAEGIVSKRRDTPYRSGRNGNWVKVKGEHREDVVVVGYLPSEKRQFRSLHCAVEEGPRLRYVGGVGTGFDAKELVRSKGKLDEDRRKTPPLDLDGAERAPKGIVWVEPRYRIEVQLAGWTGEGNLRQARFLGWREDRAPRPADGDPAAAAAPPKKTVAPEAATPETPKQPAAQKARREAVKKNAPPADVEALLEKRITHPERVMFPAVGATKLDVARHYLAVAGRILPHLDRRPVSFVRAPENIDEETFFQRHLLPGMKRGVYPIPDPQKRHESYLGIDGVEGLVTAAQFGVVELHGWMARLPDLGKPDRMVFDFDPDEGLGFPEVKDAAFAVKGILEAVGLRSYPMASGGKGLHVVVPLDASQSFDELGAFSGGIARGLAKAEPKRYVAVASKARRRGRIFIDWLRNRPYSTAVLPWSLRARPTASVAVPLAWDQVEGLKAPNQFGMAEAAARDDPWDDFFEVKQRIDEKALAFLKRNGA